MQNYSLLWKDPLINLLNLSGTLLEVDQLCMNYLYGQIRNDATHYTTYFKSNSKLADEQDASQSLCFSWINRLDLSLTFHNAMKKHDYVLFHF